MPQPIRKRNKGRTINFLGEGGGGGGLKKFHNANIFLYVAPAALLQTICFVSPSSWNIYFYLLTIYFSVFSLRKQFILKFSNPRPPVKK